MKKNHKYKLLLVDVSRLQEIASFRLRKSYAAVSVLLLLSLMAILGAVIIISTPLRELLPGYMKDEDRDDVVDAMVRVDSLRNQADANDAYLQNILKVYDIERKPESNDSAKMVLSENINNTLKGATDRESKFVSEMRARDRFNLSALTETPRGMTFSEISPTATVVNQSRDSLTMVLAISPGMPVMTVAEGLVVDCHQIAKEKNDYTVMIQHPNGYLTRYSGLPMPLVRNGLDVASSQPIAVTDGNHPVVSVELWRDGNRLIPAHYLGF